MSKDKAKHYVLCLAHKPLQRIAAAHYFLEVLMQNKNDGPPEAQGWNFNGGHVKEGETIEAAATREMLEETGIDTDPSGWSLLHGVEYPNGVQIDTLIYELTAEEIVGVGETTDKGRPLRFVTFSVPRGEFPRSMGAGEPEEPVFADSIPHLIALAAHHLY